MNWGQFSHDPSSVVRTLDKREEREEILAETVVVPRCVKCGSDDHDTPEDDVDDYYGDLAPFTTETSED